MSLSLYQISEELRLTLERVFDNDGEVSEDLEQDLARVETMLIEKTDNIVEWVEYQSDLLKLIAEKKKQLDELKKKIDSRMDSFNFYVESCMGRLEKKALTGSTRTIKIRAKTDVVNIVNEKEIPLEFIKTKAETSVDKAEIKKVLKMGADVPGAELVKSTKPSVAYGWRS